MTFDQKAYRSALGTFATGVTVVTARDASGGAHGLTVNSFTSVSLNPPMVLWCLGDSSDSWDLFSSCESFAINVLEAGQDAFAMRFAGKGDQALTADEFTTLATGSPVLSQAVASFDCTIVQRVHAGDHLILIGETQAWQSREGDGLTYFKGRFGSTSVFQPA
jgi:flavin reductase (DIM6/NTAB) family NADH-FMN oxidoreductase RutF